ncbi:metal-dependent phosphohydrolase [Phytohabitans sp. ZYX-F-186]|uniref:Metal-dependent phosphohydrolase n=1 Tax=Phytohabitans maris TaxID=3071409 RepID=A0ABU0ZJT9_9ACTN|nr:metal-dependent phosphohydrolase [Phytohabitans sp. ZYX-F-186]MDQ7906654.1 metal-dependent phosphohydrolase [Phytohabitans sp. ZYX-F-186]
MTLVERWRVAARGAGATAGDEALVAAGTALLDRWREPQRHYHTVDHLAAMLSIVDTEGGSDPVRLATWFHDAVYDPRSPGDANERESAALARTELAGLGVPAAVTAEVERLVLLTAGHVVAPGDGDGELLCDADLAVLARPPAEYDAYAAAVRREYAHVPDELFRAGRAAVLRSLLDLPALYRRPALAERWEGPARANLERELRALA